MATIHSNPSSEKNKFQVEIKEFEDSNSLISYERYETVIPVSSIVYGNKYKKACEACLKFKKNLSCPPYSPDLYEYLKDRNQAKIIGIRMRQTNIKKEKQVNMVREYFKKARSILVEELLRYRERGLVIAGSGSCLACDVCAAEEGFYECKNPNKRIYSLESLGANVSELIKICFDLDLEWSTREHTANFVCSIGAVFFRK